MGLQLVIILVFCLVAIVICVVLELHLRSSRSARSAGKRYCCHTLKIGWPLTWTKQANRAAIPPAQNKGKTAATSASRSGSNQCVNVKSGSNQCVDVKRKLPLWLTLRKPGRGVRPVWLTLRKPGRDVKRVVAVTS